MPGLVRAFWVGLAVSLGIPVAILLLAFVPGLAVSVGFFVLPWLIYAYPPYFFVAPEHLVLALWGSVALMCVLSTLFALLTRRRTQGDQWLLAVAGFAGWWLVCRLLLGAAGLVPAWQPSM